MIQNGTIEGNANRVSVDRVETVNPASSYILRNDDAS